MVVGVDAVTGDMVSVGRVWAATEPDAVGWTLARVHHCENNGRKLRNRQRIGRYRADRDPDCVTGRAIETGVPLSQVCDPEDTSTVKVASSPLLTLHVYCQEPALNPTSVMAMYVA